MPSSTASSFRRHSLFDASRLLPDHDHASQHQDVDGPALSTTIVLLMKNIISSYSSIFFHHHHQHSLHLLHNILPQPIEQPPKSAIAWGSAMTLLRLDRLDRSFGGLVLTNDVEPYPCAPASRAFPSSGRWPAARSCSIRSASQLRPPPHTCSRIRYSMGLSADQINRMDLAHVSARWPAPFFLSVTGMSSLTPGSHTHPLDFLAPDDHDKVLSGAATTSGGPGSPRHERRAPEHRHFVLQQRHSSGSALTLASGPNCALSTSRGRASHGRNHHRIVELIERSRAHYQSSSSARMNSHLLRRPTTSPFLSTAEVLQPLARLRKIQPVPACAKSVSLQFHLMLIEIRTSTPVTAAAGAAFFMASHCR